MKNTKENTIGFANLYSKKEIDAESASQYNLNEKTIANYRANIEGYSSVLLSGNTLLNQLSKFWKEFKSDQLKNQAFSVIAILMIIIVFLFCITEFIYLISILITTIVEIVENFGKLPLDSDEFKDATDTILTEIALKNIINILLFLETLETFNATMDSVNDNERRNSKWIKVIFLVSIAAVLRKVITMDFSNISSVEFIGPAVLIVILTIGYIGISFWFQKQDFLNVSSKNKS